MSRSIKIKLSSHLMAQLEYEAHLLNMSNAQYATHLIQQSLTTPLQQKNEVRECFMTLQALLHESTQLLYVLTDFQDQD